MTDLAPGGLDNGDELDSPDEAPDRRPRWWPIGVGAAIALVVVWAIVTAWVGIWGSSPAYLITLLLSLAIAIALVVWALLVGAPVQRQSWRIWSARIALFLGGAVLIGSLVYLQPLSAKPVAIDALDDGNGVTIDVSRSQIRLTPTGDASTLGLAFYPGAKVDPQAYAHVLRPVAEAGFAVVIFKQPFNLAVLDSDAANAVIGDTDDAIDQWVVGGHSLGGAVAAGYAESDRDELVALLLYAAWPVSDMSERGDGTPTISRTDAQTQIADASIRFLETVGS